MTSELRLTVPILLGILLLGLPAVAAGFVGSDSPGLFRAPHPATASLHAGKAFEFQSNFEDRKQDGWKAVNGSATIVTSPNYRGEPALYSAANGSIPQVESARTGFVRGAQYLYFEATMDVSAGTGYFGLEGPSGPVATIGVRNGSVVAGSSPTSSGILGPVPTGSAQPSGWVELIGFVYRTGSGTSIAYHLEVYADRTSGAVATAVSVPNAHAYVGAFLETTRGAVEYTNVFVTTYALAITVANSNPMEGFGQGSGGVVQVLPAFTSLSATETLRNWSVPEASVLSFQINAMNDTGTVKSTCTGFFQLGVDIEPQGHIAPWYVPGRACIAHYFGHSPSWRGFASPNGTVLDLTIRDNLSAHTIDFSLIDTSISGANRTWTTSIPYSSTEFFGAYTQLEWQVSSKHPITQYSMNGSIENLTIAGGNLTSSAKLAASYMLPFASDVPLGWDLNYYDAATAGYSQIA